MDIYGICFAESLRKDTVNTKNCRATCSYMAVYSGGSEYRLSFATMFETSDFTSEPNDPFLSAIFPHLEAPRFLSGDGNSPRKIAM